MRSGSSRTSGSSTSACRARMATNWPRGLRAGSQLPELYLVAITGWGREEDRRAMAAGFDDHLTKPALRRRLPRSSPGGFMRPSTPSSARKSAAAKHQEAQGCARDHSATPWPCRTSEARCRMRAVREELILAVVLGWCRSTTTRTVLRAGGADVEGPSSPPFAARHTCLRRTKVR